jgi:hypothetical protein
MNQNDRQFITDTISKALKEDVPAIVKAEIKIALDASNKEMKQFIVEHVSNEINELAMVMANGFQRVDEEFNKVWICLKDINKKVDSIDTRLIKVEKKVDYIGENYTRADVHFRLEKRVKKLEMVTV